MTQPYTSEVLERFDGLLENFPNGPRDGEPDYMQWVDKATNLDCLIVRNQFGALCGYVGVPPLHLLFETPYQEIEEQIDVHGCLTYSNLCQESGRVCHIPFPGRDHNIWWFGFDCAHYMEISARKISRPGRANQK